MFKNYLKIAVRNIVRNSVYSFINIFGLAVGLACSLLIMLWVSDEVSFDGFHQNKSNLYQIYGNSPADNGVSTQRAMPLPLVEEFKTNQRDIKYATATDWGSNHLLVVGNSRHIKEGLYAGEDFLKMFTFPLVRGSAETALKGSSGIVITKALAITLFGTEDALGKLIRVDDSVDATVTGVIDNVPSNSTFQFDYLLPFQSYIESQYWVKESLRNWDNNSFQIYAQLNDNASKETVEAAVRDIIKKKTERTFMEVMFHPMEKWRLWSKFENGKPSGGGITQVKSFLIVAAFILIIACINFMNLSTARSERRAKEVGIRKSVGSRRKELIFQFLGESLVVVTISYFISICIAELALPFYNNLVGKKLFIDFGNGWFWIASVAVILITGLVAGSYPAFYLSSFNASKVLKGQLLKVKGATPRKVLVVVQFVVSIFLIAGTIVFNEQIQHGLKRETGYDKENLLVIENNGDIQKNFKVIKNELLKSGIAVSATQANSPITAIFAYMGDIKWEGKRDDQRASFATIATAYDYSKTIGIKVKDGRDFSELYNDSLSMILNQAAVDYMGFREPIGAKVTWNGKNYNVVGIIDNVVMQSPYRSVEPLMMVYDPSWFAYAMVRMPKGDVSKNLKLVEGVFREHNPAYPFVYQFADKRIREEICWN
ncbi:MAG: ABC transporter permease [Cyclobacteriaceae bacterium]